MNIVIPIAGIGRRFQEAGFKQPKPLIDIGGEPMYAWAIKSLPLEHCSSLIFVAQSEHLDKLGLRQDILKRYAHYNTHIIAVDKPTAGQACTVLLAKEHIDRDEPLMIHNVDTFFVSNLWHTISTSPFSDGILSVFKATGSRWSFVRTDSHGRALEVAEKKPISDLATTGMYYFRSGRRFVRVAEAMVEKNSRVNGEFYVAPLYNVLIEEGANIGVDHASQVYCFGTPEDLQSSLGVLEKDFFSKEKFTDGKR